jgi:anti-sigma factor RsiW
MTCLDEGRLQSSLDGELQPEARRSTDAHLAGCPACSAALEALGSRDAEVAGMLDSLSGASAHQSVIYTARRRWPAAAATGALAASLLTLAILGQRPVPRPAPESAGQFLPLSDRPEPMQAGMVVRVSVPASLPGYTGAAPPSGMVQAEVIVGEDGRPRAVRFVPQ